MFGSRFGDLSLIGGSFRSCTGAGRLRGRPRVQQAGLPHLGAYENSDSHRPSLLARTHRDSPSLTYRPRQGSELLIQGEFLADDCCPDRGIPSWQGKPLDDARPLSTAIQPTTSREPRRSATRGDDVGSSRLGQLGAIRNVFVIRPTGNQFSNTLPGAVRDVNGELFVARSQCRVDGDRNLFNQLDLSGHEHRSTLESGVSRASRQAATSSTLQAHRHGARRGGYEYGARATELRDHAGKRQLVHGAVPLIVIRSNLTWQSVARR